MEKLIFNKSPAPTIGVELEIQLLSRETMALAPFAPAVLDMVPDNMIERIKPEFIKSMVEINTGICSSVAEVERDLRASYSWLNDVVEGMDGMLYPVSLHPFSRGADQEVADKERYRQIMDELQLVGRRFITQGLHVHIGVDDEEKVIRINNNLRIYLPILLAISTSSPFYEGEDTGLMSYRSKLFEALPLAGMPDSLDNWAEFEKLIKLFSSSGIIESVKDIWWDVRPHPDFGTVEIRICDLPYCLNDILALTALIQALVITLADVDVPEPHIQILRSDKWQAARYGLDGTYADPFYGKQCSMKEAAHNLYKFVRPAAEILKSTNYLDEIPQILEKRLTGAHIQKRLYREGGDFNKMIHSMAGMFLQ
ncbi:MAG: YbdK family carboxylate-amine ligase [Nitrospira sp.]|nr:YbdK family carboxylate-amine ligase [bacterium]MBL7048362.1 YbdK family carboxylate-amine ligase [Nitrospira sp.]